MSSDMELKSMLIDEYQRLINIRKIAVKENSTETVKAIDREITFIKLKLQPLELPDFDD